MPANEPTAVLSGSPEERSGVHPGGKIVAPDPRPEYDVLLESKPWAQKASIWQRSVYLIVGLLMVEHPVGAAAGLTLMVAAPFLVGGLLRIFVAATERFDGWGRALVNGMVTVLLGVLTWRQWPESSLWVIGLFVGIEMMFCGLSWVMLGLAARRLGRPAS